MPDLSAPQSLTCPGCSAPFDYDGHSATVRCPYCKTVVAIPDHLRDDLNLTPRPEVESLQEILDLVRNQQKIEAIRRFREQYGVSLKQAQASVDALERNLPIQMPTRLPNSSLPAVTTIQSSLSSAPPARKSGLTACIIPLVILLLIGGCGILFFFQSEGSGGLMAVLQGTPLSDRPLGQNPISLPSLARYSALGPAIVVKSEGQSQPAVVSMVYEIDANTRKLAWIDTAGSGNLRWTAKPASGSYVYALAEQNGLVFLASGSSLEAFRSDGSQAWSTQMTDEIIYNEKSLVVKGGRVIALTNDRTLQAFDAKTGRPAWNWRMNGYDRQIRLAGDQLLVLDYREDEYEFSVFLVNPADGSQVLDFKPVCFEGATAENSFHKYALRSEDGVIYDPATDDLYLVYGGFYGCAQRYDLASGEMVWESKNEQGYETAFSGFNSLLVSDRLYFGYDQNLASLDLATGEVKFLLDEEDYVFVPVAVEGSQMVVRVTSTRGSRKFELWGIDTASGRRLWQTAMGSSQPLDPPHEMAGIINNTNHGFTFVSNDSGSILLQFEGEPSQVVLERLNFQDGTRQPAAAVPFSSFSSDFYTIPYRFGVMDNIYWVIVDGKVYGVDLINGKQAFRWQ